MNAADLGSLGVFAVSAAVSLSASGALVVRIERMSSRFGLTEAALGMLSAFAADAPEITSSVTALLHHDHAVSTGIVVGSNLFNLAALIGVASLVGERLALRRTLSVLEAVPATLLALICAGLLTGALPSGVSLALVVAVLVPVVLLAVEGPRRLRGLLDGYRLEAPIEEALEIEEEELASLFAPRRHRPGDALVGGVLCLVVVVASVAMERTASTVGNRHHLSSLVVGGLVLAAVTSIPNAVAAIYLARRRRPAALLAEASNSNAFNVLFGLVLPATIAGTGTRTTPMLVIAFSYLAMTAVAYGAVIARRALDRTVGALVVAGYLAFVVYAVTR